MSTHHLSRRALMRGAAALPAIAAAAALPATASVIPAEPDPIFAAIEEHRAAEAEFSVAVLATPAGPRNKNVWLSL